MSAGADAETIWHDVECGAYAADLPLWEELAAAADGEVLDLGCGTGRVALHLARRGRRVIAVDREADFLAALRERAAGLPVADAARPTCASSTSAARCRWRWRRCSSCSCSRTPPTAPAACAASPTTSSRAAASRRRSSRSARARRLAAAAARRARGRRLGLLEPAVEAAVGPGEIVIHRLRQTVSPAGELREEPNRVRIATFPAASSSRRPPPPGWCRCNGARSRPPTSTSAPPSSSSARRR